MFGLPADMLIICAAPALTTGAAFTVEELTVIVTSEVADSVPSLAVSRKVYVPAAESVAVVPSAFAFPNVTVPGPLTCDHDVCRIPVGKPSSLAVPDRVMTVAPLDS